MSRRGDEAQRTAGTVQEERLARKTSIGVKRQGNAFFDPVEDKPERGRGGVLAKLAVLLVVATVAGMFLPHQLFAGVYSSMSPAVWFDALASNVHDFIATVTNTHTGGMFESTISKYVTVAIAGSALGLCGAVFQGSLRNPLASPTTLGVMVGCTLGASAFMLFLQEDLVGTTFVNISTIIDQIEQMSTAEHVMLMYGRSLCALAGGFAAIAIVLLVSKTLGHGRDSNVMLIVTGQVVSILAGSLLGLLRYYLVETGQQAKAEAIGSVQIDAFASIASFLDVLVFGIPVVACIVVLLGMRSRVGLLSFSEDESRSMGIDTGRMRMAMVLVCTAITGLVVAFCGSIGFVGFLVPHITRKVIGADFRYLLPASMLLGGTFLVVVFFVVSQFNIGTGSGLNIATSVVGCATFLVIAFRSRGDSRGAWV